MTDLTVHMGGQLVGTLDAANRRSLRFTYDPDYAAGAGSTPLSVSMPLRVSPYSHATVHPYLWGLLPDNDRVLERLARSLGLGSDEAYARIMTLAAHIPDALADAASGSHLTVDEQRIADTIRDQISSWEAAQAGGLT